MSQVASTPENRLHLTPLGIESQEDRQKYVMLETRRLLYFDGFLLKPLLQDHYESRSMRFLSDQEAANLPERYKGLRFLHLNSRQWSVQALEELNMKPDKARYNIPDEVTNLQQRSLTKTYTPIYIFETRRRTQRSRLDQRYLTYTGIQDMLDPFFEEIVNASPSILQPLYAEEDREPALFWSDYVTERGLSPTRLMQMENGSWQLNLLPEDLRLLRTQKVLMALGSYWIERGYFLHIWCNNEEMRHDAALDQVLRFMEKKKQAITGQEIDKDLLLRSTLLHVPHLTRDDVLKRARKTGLDKAVKLLELLND